MSRWRIILNADSGKSKIFRDGNELDDVISVLVMGEVGQVPIVQIECLAEQLDLEVDDE